MTTTGPPIDPLDPGERLSQEDMAARRADEFLASALAAQVRAAGGTVIVRGVCVECGDRCHPAAVYCNKRCRNDHEQRLAVLARQGRKA